jgi:hypothetical protein
MMTGRGGGGATGVQASGEVFRQRGGIMNDHGPFMAITMRVQQNITTSRIKVANLNLSDNTMFYCIIF